jgi:hypothetical protein
MAVMRALWSETMAGPCPTRETWPQPMIPILISLAMTEHLLAASRLPLPRHVAGEECGLAILSEELAHGNRASLEKLADSLL